MFVADVADYTFHVVGTIFAFALIAVFFTVQYMLCSRVKKTWIKLIPAFVVLLYVAAAILVATGDTGGSPIDLRGVVASMILIFALICGVSLGAAWVVYRVRNKK